MKRIQTKDIRPLGGEFVYHESVVDPHKLKAIFNDLYEQLEELREEVRELKRGNVDYETRS